MATGNESLYTRTHHAQEQPAHRDVGVGLSVANVPRVWPPHRPFPSEALRGGEVAMGLFMDCFEFDVEPPSRDELAAYLREQTGGEGGLDAYEIDGRRAKVYC